MVHLQCCLNISVPCRLLVTKATVRKVLDIPLVKNYLLDLYIYSFAFLFLQKKYIVLFTLSCCSLLNKLYDISNIPFFNIYVSLFAFNFGCFHNKLLVSPVFS